MMILSFTRLALFYVLSSFERFHFARAISFRAQVPLPQDTLIFRVYAAEADY